MKQHKNLTRVFAWGKQIASLLEDGGKIYFEATGASTVDFSPLQLQPSGTHSYPDLGFQHYLPGLIADHLPGSYGLKYMDAFFRKANGRLPSVSERLQFIGKHSIGALEFEPAVDAGVKGTAIEMREMYQLSKEALQGEHDFALATLIAVSNSAGGGARAKAHVGYCKESQKIYVADKHATLPPGFVHSIVKFDEYKEKGHAFIPELYTTSSVFTKTEYIYSLIARELGIVMADTDLIETGEGVHFVTTRFDRDGSGKRKHLHSLAGLLHFDASKQYGLGYESIFRTGLALGVSSASHEQIYKVMIFNLVFGNRDDHAKNFSFIMDEKRTWEFSPAYDLTFVINKGASAEHQLSIGGEPASWVKERQLGEIASKFGVPNHREIIERTIDAKHAMLPTLGKTHGLPDEWLRDIFEKTDEIDRALQLGRRVSSSKGGE